jgi:Protein of unknown function (DUF2934)
MTRTQIDPKIEHFLAALERGLATMRETIDRARRLLARVTQGNISDSDTSWQELCAKFQDTALAVTAASMYVTEAWASREGVYTDDQRRRLYGQLAELEQLVAAWEDCERTMVRVPEEEIRRRAYLKWEGAGKPQGDDSRYWLQATEEVLAGK